MTDGSGLTTGSMTCIADRLGTLRSDRLHFFMQKFGKIKERTVKMVKGRIHSIESMGLVDGPGIRGVVFFQGCNLRCKFCHNPETWIPSSGKEITSEALAANLIKLKPYFDKSGGGVTASGGEPLLQPDFLTDLFRRLKTAGIHTCIDTAGAGLGDYDEILSLTDLILYDVKAIEKDKYKELCGRDISETESFLEAVCRNNTPLIVRQVVIPSYNDTDEYMIALKEYIKNKIPTAIGTELLPYHLLGQHKYKNLGIKVPLENIPPMDKEKCRMLYGKHFPNI